MKILEITKQHRFDFHADLICEHCEYVQKITTGYDDIYYHSMVIPAITCKNCGKIRSGEVPKIKNDYGTVSV